MIDDYAANSTYYLEIRSSLKAYEGKTKWDYIEAIIATIKEQEKKHPNLAVWFIISINWERGVSSCEEEFALAKEYIIDQKNPYVVGLDFSGNPSHSDFEEFKAHIF